MKHYRSWDLVEDDEPGCFNGGTVVFEANEVRFEMARLTDAIVWSYDYLHDIPEEHRAVFESALKARRAS
jgi:hypothetical protein